MEVLVSSATITCAYSLWISHTDDYDCGAKINLPLIPTTAKVYWFPPLSDLSKLWLPSEHLFRHTDVFWRGGMFYIVVSFAEINKRIFKDNIQIPQDQGFLMIPGSGSLPIQGREIDI